MRPASCAKIAGRRGLEERRLSLLCGQLNQDQGTESRGTVASRWRARDGGRLEWRLILQRPAGKAKHNRCWKSSRKKPDEVVKRFLVL